MTAFWRKMELSGVLKLNMEAFVDVFTQLDNCEPH